MIKTQIDAKGSHNKLSASSRLKSCKKKNKPKAVNDSVIIVIDISSKIRLPARSTRSDPVTVATKFTVPIIIVE